jgi:alpha-tubulin suppressor-like RCC1 family protein
MFQINLGSWVWSWARPRLRRPHQGAVQRIPRAKAPPHTSTPTIVPGLEGVELRQVSAAYGHSIAVSVYGDVYTWGKSVTQTLSGYARKFRAHAHAVFSVTVSFRFRVLP